MNLPVPPVETYADVDVVRCDLVHPDLPSGKLYGLIPWFTDLKSRGLRGVVNHAVSYSNSHAIVAFAARETGLEAVTYANCKYQTAQTQKAAALGARVVYAGGMQLGPVRAHALRFNEPGFRQLPWGLGAPEALDGIAALVSWLKWQYDVHVVPVGAGGFACAVVLGLQKCGLPANVVGVPSTGDAKTNLKRLGAVRPVHGVTLVERPDPVETPFPSDPNYEWLAWPVARRLYAEGGSVCFWNVGVPVC